MNRLVSVVSREAAEGGASPGGGGGSGVPCSNLLFVDGGTAVDSADQDGTSGAPFATLTEAAAALEAQASNTAHVLLVTPGDYVSEGSLNWDFDNGDLVIRGLLGVDTFMVTAAGSPDPKDGLRVPSVSCSSTGGIARNLGLDSVHCPYVGVALGTLHARNSVVTYIEVNNEVWLAGCVAGAITTATTAITLTDCTFSGTPAVTFSGAAGELRLDSRSHYEFLAAGGVVTNGSIVLLSAPAPYEPEGIVSSSASVHYNFNQEDAGKYYRLTHATPELYVPTNYVGPVTVPIGTRIRGVGTAGSVVIDPQGKTVNVPAGFQLATRAAFSPFELVKVAATTWDLSGDLLPV